jgi:hypothetical protein
MHFVTTHCVVQNLATALQHVDMQPSLQADLWQKVLTCRKVRFHRHLETMFSRTLQYWYCDDDSEMFWECLQAALGGRTLTPPRSCTTCLRWWDSVQPNHETPHPSAAGPLLASPPGWGPRVPVPGSPISATFRSSGALPANPAAQGVLPANPLGRQHVGASPGPGTPTYRAVPLKK